DDRGQEDRSGHSRAGAPHRLDDLLHGAIEEVVVVRLEADADLLVRGDGGHGWLAHDLRDHARAHRPPALPNGEPQLLLHRNRRDQLDLHRHVVPRHHHLHPPPPPPHPPPPPPPPPTLPPAPPHKPRPPPPPPPP